MVLLIRYLKKKNGNFLKLVELFSKFDVIMANHLTKIQNKEIQSAHYLGKNVQNEIIKLVSSEIIRYIVQMVHDAKYFSIILDCTPDKSHMEQLSIIVRFVHKDEDCKITLQEHFLGFFEVFDSTGKGLSNYLVDFLKKHNLDIKNLRGQDYDNCANMRGQVNGVQKHILNINPRSFFVLCAAHSLKLVICDAAKINVDALNFFNTVQQLYNFFSSSTKHWNILLKNTNISLKNLSDTRWESRVEALKSLRFNIGEVLDAIVEIYESVQFDKNLKCEAQNLADKIKNFEFLCSIIIWYDLLSRINIVKKMLQNPTKCLSDATNAFNNLIMCHREYRTEKSFENITKSATILAEELEISPEFSQKILRRRQKNV